jgi:large subunit ribosomal protein L3
MSIGLIGRKCGMTRVFTEEGTSIPVSVIEITPNVITQVKTNEVDGYRAIQVTTGDRKANRLSKPLAGHFAKANVTAGRGLWEFRLEENETLELSVGDSVTVDHFKAGQIVDVIGTNKGKGFQGGVKRHHFRTQDATHGNSVSHRAPGSIGQNQSPGRVFKGKKMAGHMGDERVTICNLEIIRVDGQRNALLVKGAIPGAPDGDLIIRPACKMKNKKAVDAA